MAFANRRPDCELGLAERADAGDDKAAEGSVSAEVIAEEVAAEEVTEVTACSGVSSPAIGVSSVESGTSCEGGTAPPSEGDTDATEDAAPVPAEGERLDDSNEDNAEESVDEKERKATAALESADSGSKGNDGSGFGACPSAMGVEKLGDMPGDMAGDIPGIMHGVLGAGDMPGVCSGVTGSGASSGPSVDRERRMCTRPMPNPMAFRRLRFCS